MVSAMIELIEVHKSFDHLKVLQGVDLTVVKKEVVVVIGPSGSGKSTMLRCINGLEPIQKGKVIIEGEDLHGPKTDPNKIRQQHRHGLPELQPLPAQERAAERHAGAHEGAEEAQGRGRDDSPRAAGQGGPGREGDGATRRSSPAVSSSGWPSPAPWPCSRT